MPVTTLTNVAYTICGRPKNKGNVLKNNNITRS